MYSTPLTRAWSTIRTYGTRSDITRAAHYAAHGRHADIIALAQTCRPARPALRIVAA